MLLNHALRAASSKTPTFVTFATANNTGSSVTITRPTEVIAGDLLIISATHSDNGIFTVPAGWTSIYQSTNNDRTFVVYKYATSGEAVTYTVTSGKSDKIAAQLLVYRNAIIDTTTGVSGGTPLSVPSLTTTVANSLSLLVAGQRRGSTGAVLGTPPVGYTKLVDFVAAGSDMPGVATLQSNLISLSGTATGAQTLTFSTSDGTNQTGVRVILKPNITVAPTPNTLLVTQVGYTQQSSTSGYTVTGTVPSGTKNGDLMVAFVGNAGSNNYTVPAGWTTVANTTSSFCVAYRIAQAGDTSFTWTFNGTTAHYNMLYIVSFRNATWGSASNPATNTSTSNTLASIAANSMLLAYWSKDASSVTFSVPTGMTQIAIDNSAFGSSSIVARQLYEQAATTINKSTSALGDNIIASLNATVSPTVVNSATASGTATMVLTLSSAPVLGDTIVVALSNRNAVTWTPPDGSWSLAVADAAAQPGMAFYYKVASSAESTTYTFTGNQNTYHTGYIGVIRNGPTGGAHLVSAVQRGTGVTTATAPAITTTGNSMLFAFFIVKSGATALSVPTGYTSLASILPSSGGQLLLAYRIVPPGTYPAVSTTLTGSTDLTAAAHIALY